MSKKVDHTGLAETRQHKVNMRIAVSLAEMPQGKISAVGRALVEALAEAGYMTLTESPSPTGLTNQKVDEPARIGEVVKEPRIPGDESMKKVKKQYQAWRTEMLSPQMAAI